MDVNSQYVGPSSVGKYVGLLVWRSSLPVKTYSGPSVAWMDNGSVGPHQYAARSVRRGSESMCGAIRGLDGQSICGPSLDSVWGPQKPRCTRIQSCGVDQISAIPTQTPTPAWKNRLRLQLRLQLRLRPTLVSFFTYRRVMF